jgi:hypothetical protein
MINGIDSVEFDSDGNINLSGWPYDQEKRVDAVYDQDFNLLSSKTTDETYDYVEPEYDNKLINDRFACFDSIARLECPSVDSSSSSVIGFFDEDCLYFTGNTSMQNYVADYNKKVFNFSDDYEFAVYDYNKFQIVNKTECPTVENAKCQGSTFGDLSDKYAFAIIYFDNGNDEYIEKPYFWEYQTASINTPIEYEKYNEDELNTKINEMIADIKDKYGVDVTVDKTGEEDFAPTDSDGTSGLEYGANIITTYYIIDQLDLFMSLMPENFVQEMYSDYIGENMGYDGFEINIVKEIDGESSAYAYSDEKLHIVFATDEFTVSHIPHEFMHLIDNRIMNYYDNSENVSYDDSLYSVWSDYNPDGFCYDDDDEEYNEKYFVSVYAMTNTNEDRAETFMYLCDESFGTDWYKDGEPVKNKADSLINAISESFPSVQNSDNVFWTRNIN